MHRVIWRAKVVEPARVAFASLIKRGETCGRLRRGIDPEIGIALLLGPLIYRHIFMNKVGGAVPKDLEIHVADAFLAAYGTAMPKASIKRRSK